MKILRVLPLLLLATNLFARPQAETGVSNRLDNLYGTFFKKGGVGSAVLVAKGGRIIYEKGFGMADLEESLPVRSDTVFRIGSITKQFTAIAILQLYEQGKLDLNDEIQKYVADFPRYSNNITIENLLTHTSGIKNLTELQGLEIKQTRYSAEELIGLFKGQPLDFQPGEKFRYSNSGYILLGYVIEKVSGKSYADYINSEIFAKLGMSHSFYDDPERIIAHRAKGYELDSSYKLANAAYLNMSFPYSAGGLAMTVEDYLKWYQGLMANRLVRAETLQKALTPFQLNNKTFTNYGYGWAFRDIFGSKAIEHGGRINGFNAKETYLPQQDILVVIFSNGGFVNTDIINDQAVAIVAEKPQVKEMKISAAAKQRYIGQYKFPSDDSTTLNIYNSNGELFLKDSNSPTAWKMHFIKEDEFICYEVFPNTHVFSLNENAEVEALIIKNSGNEIKVKKVK